MFASYKTLFWLLLSCNTTLLVHSAFFNQKPAPFIKKQVGEDVTLLWNITLSTGQTVLFMTLYYSKTGAADSVGQRIGHGTNLDPPFRARAHLTPNGALTLYNVRVEDGGYYSCRVEFNYGAALSNQIQLLVGVTPVIKPFLDRHLEYLEGTSIKLSCNASGIPSPKVVWYRRLDNNSFGQLISNNASLVLTNVSSLHSGLYHCSASNYMDTINEPVNINIYAKPGVLYFYHTASLDDTIYECQSVGFFCDGNVGTPSITSYNFYHNGTLFLEDSVSGEFAIEVVRARHTGTYTCVPVSKIGEGFNKTIHLKVKEAPYNCRGIEITQTTLKTPTPKVPHNCKESDSSRSTLTTLTSRETANEGTDLIGSSGKRSSATNHHPIKAIMVLAVLFLTI